MDAKKKQNLASGLWSLKINQKIFFLSLFGVFLVACVMRFIYLDTLQDESYGDVHIIWEFVDNIQRGLMPITFNQSAGPLYHYLITPLAYIFGNHYDTFKLASVLVSLVGLVGVYLLSRDLLDDWLALFATFIAGVGSWYLIFSRLGNSQILVPILVIFSLWFLLRYLKEGKKWYLIASAVVGGLGLYLYPPSFIIAPVNLILLCVLAFTGYKDKITWKALGIYFAAFLVTALLFVRIVQLDSANFLNGYIGGKLNNAAPVLPIILNNIRKSILAFYVDGDIIFRSNPTGLPHLDVISGVLSVLGFVFWLTPPRRKLSPILFVPLILLHLPSILVLSAQNEIPSASRTLGIAPIMYIFSASGLWWLLDIGWKKIKPFWPVGVAVLILCLGIFAQNKERYFDKYISGLPYSNTPIAEYVTQYVDTLSPNTSIYMFNCCWEHSMPEPKGVIYEMQRPKNWKEMLLPPNDTCETLANLPSNAVLIWNYKDDLPSKKMESCRNWLPAQTFYSAKGLPLFRAAPLFKGGVDPTSKINSGTPAPLITPASPISK